MSVVTGNARFTDLSVEEQRVVAERISKLRSAPWRPFWCPDVTCNGDPHPLLTADGGRIYASEMDLVGPNGEPIGFEDPDGRVWGERRYPYVEYKYVLLDPHWAHNHARADQRLPRWDKPWTLFAMSGRGTGKTTFGVEFVTLCARKGLDGAILGRRGTEIINTHVATLIARAHPEFKPEYLASKDLIVWPEVTMPDGTVRRPKTFLFSAEKPENIRSINISYTWVDEAAFMDEIETAWMNLKMATRVKVPGNPIHHLITSTPTPTPWVKKMEDEAKDSTTSIEVRRVSTYANAANLDPDFLADLEREYEGTRMGRQELHGEVLRDVEGAFWNDDMFQYIDAPNTEKFLDVVESMDIRVTAIDPAGSKGKRSDETGIVAVGAQHFEDGQRLRASRFYALADGTLKGSPTEWAERAFAVARLTDSNYIVAEKNFGGDMVKQVLDDFADKFPEKAKDNRGEAIQIKVVRAVQSKETRAEGTVGKYEQGRFYHVKSKTAYGDLSKMETEMVEWVPKSRGGKSPSPNRVDALVWAARECDTGQPYETQGADLKSIKQKIKKGGAKKSALQRFN